MKQIILSIIITVIASSAWSQSDLPEVTDKVFIKNAFITTKAGSPSFFGSISIDDGLITNVGRSLTAPYDAMIIDADSAYIYPAFIATISHIGIKSTEESDERPKVERTGYPPNDVAGITPEKGIKETFHGNESGIKDYRESGFAIAHVVPKGRMLPGKGSVMSLSGGDYDNSIIKEDISLYAQFKGANRVFPATTIGVMAKWRELYKNAELSLAHQQAYANNPLNKKRAQTDAATSGLYPVVQKEIPVFFQTNGTLDISRAIQLQKDLGFDLMLSEVKHGSKAFKKVRQNNLPLLFSLDLPKKDETKEEDLTPESKKLLARKNQSRMDNIKQVSNFAGDNGQFAFSYFDVKAKSVLENIGTLIENGLAPERALAALTVDAAKALNIDNISGSLERGKMANIVMMSDTIFTKNAKIKAVFVDGKMHKIKIKEKKKSDKADGDLDIVGTWKYEIEIPGMEPSGKMEIKKDGDDYTITLTSDQAPDETMEASNIEQDGNNISFDFQVNTQGMSIQVSNSVTFDGDTLEGDVSIPDFGSFSMTGEKISKPEE